MTATSITFDLPWPPAKLNPNSRVHWSARSPKARKARQDAMLVARATANAAGLKIKPGTDINVALLFMPSVRRKRDRDNAQAQCKSLLDGVADGLGVNDCRFIISANMATELVPQATVRVRVSIDAGTNRVPATTDSGTDGASQ